MVSNEIMIKFIRATHFRYEDVAEGAGISAAVLKTWLQNPLDDNKVNIIMKGLNACVEQQEKLTNTVKEIQEIVSRDERNE